MLSGGRSVACDRSPVVEASLYPARPSHAWYVTAFPLVRISLGNRGASTLRLSQAKNGLAQDDAEKNTSQQRLSCAMSRSTNFVLSLSSNPCHAERRKNGRSRPFSRSRSIPTLFTVLHPVVPVFAQIKPLRIHRLDQHNLLFPAPTLELLFAIDCLVNLIVRLPIKKPLDIVVIREARNTVKLVLECPLVQVACHSDVECAGNAAHDVNTITSSSAHEGIGVLRLSASSQAKKRLRSGGQGKCGCRRFAVTAVTI